ncbi:MAG: lysophospholipid acyltransferase family protein [Planctomycetota bacterium]|nr:lysophospholipid acyltransferase family protein [Planctomycetota bacterium]
MTQRYFAEPYRFIGPEESTWFIDLFRHITPYYYPWALNLKRWSFPGLEHLKESYQKNAGILLCSNHQSGMDPLLLGKLAEASGRWIHFITSHHLLKEGEILGEVIRRLGGYSIFRDGPDLVSVKKTIELLREGKRAVLVFPEGTYYKQNDRIGPLLEGTGLILRKALQKATRPIVIHLIAVKYWFLEDPMPSLRLKWSRLEKEWGLLDASLEDDLTRLEAILSKGIERLLGKEAKTCLQPGRLGSGDFDTALGQMVAKHFEVKPISDGDTKGPTWSAIRKLRQGLIKDLVRTAGFPKEEEEIQEKLSMLLKWENVTSLSMGYVREKPTVERIWETFARLEEALTDCESTFPVPVEVVLSVSKGIDLSPQARPLDLDPQNGEFGSRLREKMQAHLDSITLKSPVVL